MAKVTVYGIGGYDPKKPNNNVVEDYETEDVVVEEEVELKLDKQHLSELLDKANDSKIDTREILKELLTKLQ